MTTSIDKLIAGMSARKAGPQSFNGAVSKIAPKATNGGTTMPGNFAARMAKARAAKGKMPKAVAVKPLNKASPSRAKAGGNPGAVNVPANPVMPLTNTATNTTAGNTTNGLHIHVHLPNGGY